MDYLNVLKMTGTESAQKMIDTWRVWVIGIEGQYNEAKVKRAAASRVRDLSEDIIATEQRLKSLKEEVKELKRYLAEVD